MLWNHLRSESFLFAIVWLDLLKTGGDLYVSFDSKHILHPVIVEQ